MGTTDSDELPEAIIHRIQSLLSLRQAARTTLLSKSWRAAWSTRPTIHLDESHFPRDSVSPSRWYPHLDPLTEFATNTFRRYDESNLRIDTFGLCLNSDWYSQSGLAAKWTSKALEMGATNLTFGFDYHKGLYIPIKDIFGFESVVTLRLERLDMDRPPEVIKCSGLTSLTLSYLSISGESFLRLIISSCPLIENLSLSYIECYDYSYDKNYRKDVVAGSVIRLHKLTSLVLCRNKSEVETFFLDGLSSKFPNLKELTVCFQSENEIQIISSPSIEILNFEYIGYGYQYHEDYDNDNEEILLVEFDVPSIRKFTFEGDYMPKLSFMSTPCDQFQSHVLVKLYGEPSVKWFCELSKFLSQLRGSRMHLCLRMHSDNSFDYQAEEIKGLNMCEVEDLTMDTKGLPSLSFDALLDGLFRMCHPMMITQYVSHNDDDDYQMLRPYDDTDENTINNDISLCEALEQGMKVKRFLTSQFMYGLRDLEDVNAQELFDEVWMTQSFESVLDSLYDESVRREQRRRFRFQLKWKSL